jgi:hypothetical protein
MNTNWKGFARLALCCAFLLCPNLMQAQESAGSIRRRFTVLPSNRPCQPAQVKTIALGRQPIEAILAQVTVENLSEKEITAVKLGWNVYDEKDGGPISLSACTDPRPSARIFLSGVSQLIQLETLAPKETSTIGIKPLPVPSEVKKIAFVERPLITVDDVRSLPADGSGKPPKPEYTIVFFVSEIHYSDGTRWMMGK